MPQAIFYLQEPHNFPHMATVPWPWTTIKQQDWVDSLFTLEDWLNLYVGRHLEEWAYAQQPCLEYTKVCIAFKQSRYKTLFLLTWS